MPRPPHPRRDREAAAVLATVALCLLGLAVWGAVQHHAGLDLAAEIAVGIIVGAMLFVAWALWARAGGGR